MCENNDVKYKTKYYICQNDDIIEYIYMSKPKIKIVICENSNEFFLHSELSLYNSISGRHFADARYLLRQYFDKSFIMRDKSLLIHTCISGSFKISKLLVKTYNVDINYIDKYGNNALHYACMNNHFKIIKMLVNKKIFNIKNFNGLYPIQELFNGYLNDYKKIKNYLLNKGYDCFNFLENVEKYVLMKQNFDINFIFIN